MANPNPKPPPAHARWKKGQSGNPQGRPKLPDLSALMDKTLGEEKDGVTAAEAILKKLRQMAAQGNLKAAEMLLDRGYGKPKQAIDHSGTLATNVPQVNIVVQPPTKTDG
jgi:hypothetical protein